MDFTIPADLLERVRQLPGAAERTEAQLVALCLEASIKHSRNGKALEALEGILETQDAGFSRMVLEYAQALAGLDLARQGLLHGTVIHAAKFQIDKARILLAFVQALS